MAFLILLGIGIMGGVVYMAISRKSSFKIRIAALGALALMIISVIICTIIYFNTAAVPKQLILPDMLPSDMPPPQPKSNPLTMIMLVIFLIGLFVATFVMSLREQRRSEGKELPDGDW